MTYRLPAATLATLATVFVLSGCVALPFAVPPIEYSGGIGAGTHSDGIRLAVPVRGTVYPAGLIEKLYKRNWDLGAGYQLLLPVAGEFYHGPVASFGYYEIYTRESGPRPSMWRVGLHGSPGLAFDAYDGDLGYSLSARVTGEYVAWSEGAYGSCGTSSDGCVLGVSYGESSAGLYADVSYWVVDPSVWTVTVGLLIRAPATAGILFAWILN